MDDGDNGDDGIEGHEVGDDGRRPVVSNDGGGSMVSRAVSAELCREGTEVEAFFLLHPSAALVPSTPRGLPCPLCRRRA